MKNVSMNKVNKDVLLEALTGELNVKIPAVVEVLDTQTGAIKQEDGTEMKWASLTVVDSEELEVMRSVGYEDNANQLKVKLADYKGDDISLLIGQLLDTSNMELVFIEKRNPRGTQIEGLAFRTTVEDLKEGK